MIRSSFAEDRYAPGTGEADFVIGGLSTWTGDQPLGVVVAHGSGTDAVGTAYTLRSIFRDIGKYATIHCGDLGWQTWGSDLVVTRIGEAIDLLVSEHRVERVALLGASMGGCSVLNYALRHPEHIACVAALIPLVDLADARANPWLTSRWPEIDAIYGAPPAADYTGHNPVDFATSLDPDMPIRIWGSSDDGLVRPPTIQTFLAARPQTEFTDLGPVGHTVPAAANGSIVSWLASHLVVDHEPSTYPATYPATY